MTMFTRVKAKRWVAMLSLFAFVGCGGNDEPKDTQGQGDPNTEDSTPKKENPEPGDPSENEESGSSTTGQEPEDSKPESTGENTGDAGTDSGDSTSETPDDTSSSDTTDEDGKINCSALKVTGTSIGEVPENLEMLDAQGNKVSLHEHCNDVLFLAAATAF